MVLVVAIVLGTWLLVATAVLLLCLAAHRLDEEIEREPSASRLADIRLPLAP